jgi:hypothetical protein
MYIVPIAWLYVAVMMAVAEATNTTGTVLGGIVTFLMYGLLPVGLVVYLMGAPLRRRAIKAQELAGLEAARAVLTGEPNACSKAASDTVAAERKEA